MNLTVKDKFLSFHVCELFENLDDEALAFVVDSLACQDRIIEEVANQILDGFTTDGSYGLENCSGDEPSTALSKARRRVAEGASDVAKKEIDKLQSAYTRKDKAWREELSKRIDAGRRVAEFERR